jgi:TolB protein
MTGFVTRGLAAAAALTMVTVVTAAAQDSLPPLEQGVRIGITYTPGVRPGMLVLGGARSTRLDSARTILARDLNHSDAFEMITLPMGDDLVLSIDTPESGTAEGADDNGTGSFVNFALYAALGADYAVNVRSTVDSVIADSILPDSAVVDSALVVALFNVRGEVGELELRIPVGPAEEADFRMELHRAADELVRAVTGAPGVAATSLLLISRGRVYQMDSDGARITPLSPSGVNAMSPVWSPDGRQILYMEFSEGRGILYDQNVDTGHRGVVPPTTEGLNFAATFTPDGRSVAFARAGGEGTDIFTYNLSAQCCLQRLTVGRLWDNLSPTFSPDGRQIAYVSTRVGQPQIYVMASDGTGQELFAPFEWGVTGSSNAPEWSPDGLNITFHRDIAGSPQVFVMDVASRDVRQLTSAGRNHDPTWAPDGRHLAFVSTRTGAQQVWIIDLDTGRVRQLTRLGEARLPSWSGRLEKRNN